MKKKSPGQKVECAFDKMVPVEEIIPNPRNPNKHPKKQLELLSKIIKAQGWRAPITVSNRSGFIVRGHARLEAAKILGLTECPVDFQDYENEAVEWADCIADNRIAELAEPDLPLLKDLLTELDTGAFDMDLTGFDTESIESLMTQLHEPNFGDVKTPLQEAIDKKEAELKEQFAEKMRQDLQKHIQLICPECGHEYSVKAEDLLKDSSC
ncbi:ParB/Srx family N-terminal domain-containing protein [Candidatus Pacearchaeota archaeon]|jgi:ParB-like chromosome segregation protein Spo0J|nr:ParB/Srx family N-terminal domain-containing protein [Candidatus Pacearchaeota archaeon]